MCQVNAISACGSSLFASLHCFVFFSRRETTQTQHTGKAGKEFGQAKMIDIKRVLNKLKNSNRRQTAADQRRTDEKVNRDRTDMEEKKGEN